MGKERIILGKNGEELAADFLTAQGYQLVSRNYRCSLGEVDMVVWDGDWLVFVEVRTKTSERFGTPAESVTARKIQKIRRVAEHFISSHPDLTRKKVRFDFVGLIFRGEQQQIEHYKGVF